jgi:hypothetical protein
MEDFSGMTNVADILEVGDSEKCFEDELYRAAQLLHHEKIEVQPTLPEQHSTW